LREGIRATRPRRGGGSQHKRESPDSANRGFLTPANAPCGQLKSSEKFLPRRCNQCLRGCMPVGTNEHRRLLHFFRVGCFDDVYDIKATQSGKALFPDHTGTLLLSLLRHGLAQILEIFRMIESFLLNATEHYECR